MDEGIDDGLVQSAVVDRAVKGDDAPTGSEVDRHVGQEGVSHAIKVDAARDLAAVGCDDAPVEVEVDRHALEEVPDRAMEADAACDRVTETTCVQKANGTDGSAEAAARIRVRIVEVSVPSGVEARDARSLHEARRLTEVAICSSSVTSPRSTVVCARES